jgi:predicted metal-dependent peptidase
MGRRSEIGGIRFPYREPEAKACALIIDTLGSVDEAELIQALSEAAEIVKQSGCHKLLMILHDSRVYYCSEVDINQLKKLPYSPGGTSHEEVFEVLNCKSEKWPLKEKPALAICFTDLMTCFPSEEPSFPTMWAVFEGYEEHPVPWGRKVKVPVNRKR